MLLGHYESPGLQAEAASWRHGTCRLPSHPVVAGNRFGVTSPGPTCFAQISSLTGNQRHPSRHMATYAWRPGWTLTNQQVDEHHNRSTSLVNRQGWKVTFSQMKTLESANLWSSRMSFSNNPTSSKRAGWCRGKIWWWWSMIPFLLIRGFPNMFDNFCGYTEWCAHRSVTVVGWCLGITWTVWPSKTCVSFQLAMWE